MRRVAVLDLTFGTNTLRVSHINHPTSFSFQPSRCGEKKEDPAKKKVAPDDLITLAPYLLQVSIVPDEADEASIGSANNTEIYIAWKEK